MSNTAGVLQETRTAYLNFANTCVHPRLWWGSYCSSF